MLFLAAANADAANEESGCSKLVECSCNDACCDQCCIMVLQRGGATCPLPAAQASPDPLNTWAGHRTRCADRAWEGPDLPRCFLFCKLFCILELEGLGG